MKLARRPALLAGLGPAPPSEAKAQPRSGRPSEAKAQRAQPALPRSGRPSEAKAQRAQPALPRSGRPSVAKAQPRSGRPQPSMASNMRAFPPSPAPLLGARRNWTQSIEQEQQKQSNIMTSD